MKKSERERERQRRDESCMVAREKERKIDRKTERRKEATTA